MAGYCDEPTVTCTGGSADVTEITITNAATGGYVGLTRINVPHDPNIYIGDPPEGAIPQWPTVATETVDTSQVTVESHDPTPAPRDTRIVDLEAQLRRAHDENTNLRRQLGQVTQENAHLTGALKRSDDALLAARDANRTLGDLAEERSKHIDALSDEIADLMTALRMTAKVLA